MFACVGGGFCGCCRVRVRVGIGNVVVADSQYKRISQKMCLLNSSNNISFSEEGRRLGDGWKLL